MVCIVSVYCFAGMTLCIGSMIGCGLEYNWEKERIQNEAVKHHAAEYYLDENHARQFRWLAEGKDTK